MAGKGVTVAKRPIRQLSIREKIDAIDRVHGGESKASVARDIGVPESTLRGWCKSEDKLRVVARTCGTPDSQHSGDSVVITAAAPALPLNMSVNQELAVNMTKTEMMATPPPVQPPPPSSAKSQPEVNEALWFWLKQQQQVALGSPLLDPKLSSCADKDSSSWFWRWYKNFGYNQYPEGGAVRPEALNGAALPLTSNARSTLDSVMMVNGHDNNNVSKRKLEESEDDEEDEPPATPAEAVGHGEKFLRWLECCSDPSVTAMQILQFRYLLNNVRACASRRAKQGKMKTTQRRRK